MRSRLSTLTVVGLLLVGSAVGADDSFYVTAKLGRFDRDLELGPFNSVKTDRDSWVAGFGYRLNRHLAFQAEYLDFGVVDHTRWCGPPEKLCLSLPPVTLETDAGSFASSFVLEQNGTELTGHYTSEVFGEVELKGSVSGNDVTFSFTGSAQGYDVELTYTGTLQDDGTLSGQIDLGGLGGGTFTGKKK